MNEEKLQEELLKLPLAAWFELEDLSIWEDTEKLLVKKRLWIQKELNKLK